MPKRGYGGIDTAGTGRACGRAIGRFAGIVQRLRCGSESVDELLEQGNAFEAEVVKGVEDAGDADEGEFKTTSAGEDYLGVVNAYFGQNSSSTIDFPHESGAGL